MAGQQSTEEEEASGFTSNEAMAAYGLIAVPLFILCLGAVYRCVRPGSNLSSCGTQPPVDDPCLQAVSVCPQAPTLLESRRAASFNEKKEKDLESGQTPCAFSQGHDSEKIDLDELILNAEAIPKETSASFSCDGAVNVEVTQGSIDDFTMAV